MQVANSFVLRVQVDMVAFQKASQTRLINHSQHHRLLSMGNASSTKGPHHVNPLDTKLASDIQNQTDIFVRSDRRLLTSEYDQIPLVPGVLPVVKLVLHEL